MAAEAEQNRRRGRDFSPVMMGERNQRTGRRRCGQEQAGLSATRYCFPGRRSTRPGNHKPAETRSHRDENGHSPSPMRPLSFLMTFMAPLSGLGLDDFDGFVTESINSAGAMDSVTI